VTGGGDDSMFEKNILVADRDESGRATAASARPDRLVREAHAGEPDPIGESHV